MSGVYNYFLDKVFNFFELPIYYKGLSGKSQENRKLTFFLIFRDITRMSEKTERSVRAKRGL